MEQIEETFTFIAPKIELPELRVYYDNDGNIICYSCEKLDGNFLVIDKETYAEGRHDLKVIEGKLTAVNSRYTIFKLKPNINGIKCASEDINIIVDDDYNGSTTSWKLDIYELK